MTDDDLHEVILGLIFGVAITWMAYDFIVNDREIKSAKNIECVRLVREFVCAEVVRK